VVRVQSAECGRKLCEDGPAHTHTEREPTVRPKRQHALGRPAPPPAHGTDTSITGGTHFAFVCQSGLLHAGRPKQGARKWSVLDYTQRGSVETVVWEGGGGRTFSSTSTVSPHCVLCGSRCVPSERGGGLTTCTHPPQTVRHACGAWRCSGVATMGVRRMPLWRNDRRGTSSRSNSTPPRVSSCPGGGMTPRHRAP